VPPLPFQGRCDDPWAITAAMVGVVLNLAIWFALQTLYLRVGCVAVQREFCMLKHTLLPQQLPRAGAMLLLPVGHLSDCVFAASSRTALIDVPEVIGSRWSASASAHRNHCATSPTSASSPMISNAFRLLPFAVGGRQKFVSSPAV
jgi:hypothetical protein